MKLISFIETTELSRKNRTIHFGNISYESDENLMISGAIPEEFNGLLAKINELGYSANQLSLDLYEPAWGLKAKIERHSMFKENIFILTLLSGCGMHFIDKKIKNRQYGIPASRRSLILLFGEVRYSWAYGISRRKKDYIDGSTVNREKRISITLRKLNKKKRYVIVNI